jgi:uncharacterized membrane-anchored protein
LACRIAVTTLPSGPSCWRPIFWYWQRSEGTLSIHSIVTQRRELDYWATVFATFALGTALGDFTATALHLGYLASGIALRGADHPSGSWLGSFACA